MNAVANTDLAFRVIEVPMVLDSHETGVASDEVPQSVNDKEIHP